MRRDKMVSSWEQIPVEELSRALTVKLDARLAGLSGGSPEMLWFARDPCVSLVRRCCFHTDPALLYALVMRLHVLLPTLLGIVALNPAGGCGSMPNTSVSGSGGASGSGGPTGSGGGMAGAGGTQGGHRGGAAGYGAFSRCLRRSCSRRPA